ncbi:hypothetical protein G7046_g4733 [Stylonectria norvegica]|nr:hypothetical protein G7046_g4733 [Stylonectria norvegica]
MDKMEVLCRFRQSGDAPEDGFRAPRRLRLPSLSGGSPPRPSKILQILPHAALSRPLGASPRSHVVAALWPTGVPPQGPPKPRTGVTALTDSDPLGAKPRSGVLLATLPITLELKGSTQHPSSLVLVVIPNLGAFLPKPQHDQPLPCTYHRPPLSRCLPSRFTLAMTSEVGSPKREPTPNASLSSIPQKRALDEGHSPAVPSPLNPEVKPSESQPPEDAPQGVRAKPARSKKETLKKRESKGGTLGGDSARATPDPRAAKEPEQSGSRPLRFRVAPPKPSDFDLPRGPVMTVHHEVQTPSGETVEFLETSDHVFNKRNYQYTHCIADPLFPSMLYYRHTEPEPYGPRMSFEDAATHVYFDKSARQITTDKGFRMARANVAVREGRWYWECKITQGIRKPKDGVAKPEGGRHVRVGWARREASVDAPVGFDAYSYGIRDVSGEKVYMSRPKEFFPAGEGIQEGDVIGLEIQLPSEHLHRKVMSGNYNPVVDKSDDELPPAAEAPNIVRDRLPIRFKAHTYFEKIDYHPTKELEDLMNPAPMGPNVSSEPPNAINPIPALRTLPNSYIKVYKNGVLMGTAFEDLLGFLPPASKPAPNPDARVGLDDGMLGYYPAVSVFRGGSVETNFGPDFWYPPPGYDSTDNAKTTSEPRVRAVSERYQDQIAEDIVYDIIDEVDFWMQDGGGATDRQGVSAKSEAVALAPGREEIKELVQDDY